MKRIGIAASKISKGNTVVYNLCVVLIACSFSLFIFIVAGATIALALTLIGYIGTEVMGRDFQRNWRFVMAVCMAALTVVVVLFNVFAVLINIRWTRKF
ncbi:MAG: hypothetical protein HZA29_02790 [Candidatus Omnitrophica bacterium]|nr:hypothetical protein [Candidatus Omnitrophota bacterium]